MSLRVRPNIEISSSSKRRPAAPTNGSPFRSSWNPGASPTNIRSDRGLPTPKTTLVRVPRNGQWGQALTTCSSCAKLWTSDKFSSGKACSPGYLHVLQLVDEQPPQLDPTDVVWPPPFDERAAKAENRFLMFRLRTTGQGR